jgi:hypothetical protein
MVIEKNAKEFVIRIPATVDITEIQTFLDYLRYRDLVSTSVATMADVEQLVTSVKQNWRTRRSRAKS